MKTKSMKNLIFGMLSQLVILSLGIVLPRLFMVNHGSEVNGLLASVKQIMGYMSLLEAGVGVTTMQALYGPLSRESHREVSAVLSATNKYYKKTGFAYGILVIVISFVYAGFIKTTIPPMTVIILILLEGAPAVIRYIYQGKYLLLLQADGKNYILANLTMTITVMSDAAQIILLLCGFQIIAVKFAFFAIHLLQMLFILWYVHKHYRWIDLNETPKYEALKEKNSALVHSVSGLIFNNTDTLLLTIFCGLKTVSVYSVYSLIYAILANVVDVVTNSFRFILGQTFHSDFQRFKKMQDAYESVFLAFSFSLVTLALIFTEPFIALYTKNVTDISYIDPKLPILFATIGILNYGRIAANQVITFAGHFKRTQNRAVLEAAINLSVSIVGVHYWGIYGVLIGTIAALLYRANDVILYTHKYILHSNPLSTYKKWAVNLLLLIVITNVFKFVPMNIESLGKLILCGMTSSVVVILIFGMQLFIFEKGSLQMVIKILSKS